MWPSGRWKVRKPEWRSHGNCQLPGNITATSTSCHSSSSTDLSCPRSILSRWVGRGQEEGCNNWFPCFCVFRCFHTFHTSSPWCTFSFSFLVFLCLKTLLNVFWPWALLVSMDVVAEDEGSVLWHHHWCAAWHWLSDSTKSTGWIRWCVERLECRRPCSQLDRWMQARTCTWQIITAPVLVWCVFSTARS